MGRKSLHRLDEFICKFARKKEQMSVNVPTYNWVLVALTKEGLMGLLVQSIHSDHSCGAKPTLPLVPTGTLKVISVTLVAVMLAMGTVTSKLTDALLDVQEAPLSKRRFRMLPTDGKMLNPIPVTEIGRVVFQGNTVIGVNVVTDAARDY